MKISVIILDYLKADRVVENVKSLKAQKWHFELEIVVVDNSINESNASKLEELESMDNVRLIVNKKNTWYTKWNNLWAKDAVWDYIFIINPDIICKSDYVFEKLISYLEANKDVWIIGPKQLNEDWSMPAIVRKFPKVSTQIIRRTFLKKLPILKNIVWDDEMRNKDLDLISEVDWIQSSFMVIRRIVWDKLKWFDKKYFIFVSDAEICFQCWKFGYKVIYNPSVTVFADWKRCSEWWMIKFFNSTILRQHFLDSLKYSVAHFFDWNPRKDYYINKNTNLV